MDDRMTPDQILDFAIEREQEAHDFYMDLAAKVQAPAMRDVFRQFAQEELAHKQKLTQVKAGKRLAPAAQAVQDLKIGDYLVIDDPTPDIDYPNALLLAMRKEKAAFRLYSELAQRASEGELRQLLMGLAQEEARHKLRFEIEYDENVLREN